MHSTLQRLIPGLLSMALASGLALPAASASAKTLKWASAGEIPTWDPHSQNLSLTNGVHAWVYESLVYYNKKFEIEPMLATKWELKTPTQMRIDKVVKVDDLTVDILLEAPNPVLLRQLTELRILNKAWAEKNNSVRPKDARSKDETFAHRNTNGTGPMMLKEWQTDVKSVLVRNPNWWGKLEDDITEVIYLPIKSDATRTAALLSGEVDMLLDPPPQDTPRLRQNDRLKVLKGPRTAPSSWAWTSSATSCRART